MWANNTVDGHKFPTNTGGGVGGVGVAVGQETYSRPSSGIVSRDKRDGEKEGEISHLYDLQGLVCHKGSLTQVNDIHIISS